MLKILLDRKEPSSDEVRQHQNFNEILSKTEDRDKKLIIDNAATPYSFWEFDEEDI